jgi:predicted PurR-regulated permease PerM
MWKKLSKGGIIMLMFRKIDISHRTIIFTVLFLLGLWLLYYIRGILLMLFVAFLLMTMFEPLVKLITKIKIHRTLAVIITYVVVVGILGGVIALISPILAQETGNFINSLPTYLSNIGIDSSVTNNLMGTLVQQIGGVLNFTFSVFSNVFAVFTVLVFTFYMLLGYEGMKKQLGGFLGEERGKKISKLLTSVETRLGQWSRGELLLMSVVALGNYLGYLLLGLPFALPLALLTGIFEIVPTLGPIIAAIPAVLVGLGISPWIGAGAAGVCFVVNQLENYILVPKIMHKATGVPPLLILISVALGAKLGGVVGVIIAVPFVLTIQVILQEYFAKE